MIDLTKRMFVGIKITKALQNELDSPAPGSQQYFQDGGNNEFLQIVSLGEQKIIGKYIQDGFPATDIGKVSRTVSTMLKLITRGRRIEENDIQIYSF